MGERIELPQTPQGTAEEQMRQMYSYLYRVAEALNHNLSEIGSMDLTDEERVIMQQITAEEEGEAAAAYDWQGKESLKSLIIKTAAFVQNKLDVYRMNLLGEYVTEGKFGKYVRNTSLKVDVTPSGIQQDFTFEEVVQGLKNYTVNAKNYIKTGLLRTVSGVPVYGVAIGKDVVTFSEDGTETYNDGNKVAELTADELSFYQNGNKVASYKGTELVFYNGGVAKMKIDSTGVSFLDGSTKLAELLTTALKFYYNGTLRTQMDTDGVKILNGSTKLAELLTTALKFYYNGSLRTQMDNDGVSFWSGSTKLAEMNGTALKFYYNGTLRTQMDTDGVSFWNGSTKLAELKSGEINFYQNSALIAKYSGGKISFYSGGTEVMYIQNGQIVATGAMKIQSGGSFDVDSTNFSISSAGKSITSGEWKLYSNGLIKIYFNDWLQKYVGVAFGDYQAFWEEGIEVIGFTSNIAQGVSYNSGTMYLTMKYEDETFGRLLFDVDKGAARIHAESGQMGVGNLTDLQGQLGTRDGTWDIWGDNITYNTLVQNSSRLVKQDIQPMPDMGEKLDKLEPVTFAYRKDAMKKRRAGFIYEDTEPVMPEICTDIDGNKAINYVELIPMLVKEIQELRKRVKALEERQ